VKVTWTKGADPNTGKPVDYDPQWSVQLYAVTTAIVAVFGL
jgi:alcohol dehydrogenase (cytochrome c)